MSGELRKSAFGGFKRKEVLDYIEQLNVRACEKETQLNEKLDEATKANKTLEEAVTASTEKAKNLETLLQEKTEQAQALTEENQELREKLEKAQAALEEADARSAKAEEELHLKSAALTAAESSVKRLSSQLEEKSDSLEHTQAKLVETEADNSASSGKINELKEKGKRYDELTHQLGQVFIDAHERANLMLNNAETEVHNLAESTNASAKELAEDFIALQENVKQIRSRVNSSLDVMNDQLISLNKEIEAAIKRLESGIKIQPVKPEPKIKTPDFIASAIDEARADSKSAKKNVATVKAGLFDSLIRRDKKNNG